MSHILTNPCRCFLKVWWAGSLLLYVNPALRRKYENETWSIKSMYFLLTESPQGDDRVSVQLCYRRVCEFWESKDKIKDWDMKDYTLGTRSEASELRLDVDLGLKISAQDQKRTKREQKSSVRLINTNNKWMCHYSKVHFASDNIRLLSLFQHIWFLTSISGITSYSESLEFILGWEAMAVGAAATAETQRQAKSDWWLLQFWQLFMTAFLIFLRQF